MYGKAYVRIDFHPTMRPLAEKEADDRPLLFPRRYMLPPMSAKTWETMSDSLFRSLVTSNLDVLVSPAAHETLVRRAKSLGIDL